MTAFKKVLCPCDFSHISQQVLDHAIDLCEKTADQGFDVELCLLHVVHPAPITIPAAVGDGIANFAAVAESYAALNKEAQEAAAAKLRRMVSARVPKRIPTTILTPCGDGALEILSAAEELKSDVIVMGTHGVTGWRHFMLGSVTEEVIRLAPCPVFAIGPHQRAVQSSPERTTKILCPVDFSEASVRALKQAGELAVSEKADLHVLHVLEKVEPVLGIVSREEFQEARFGDAAQSLLPIIEEHVPAEIIARVKLNRLVREGDPAAEIVNVALDEKFDFIVLSTQGQGGWRRLMFGSVAEEVVRTAPCPVLAVRAHPPAADNPSSKKEPTDASDGEERAEQRSGDGRNPYEVDENEFPRFASADEKLRFLLNYAVLAPSARNTQPWIWKLKEDHLELHADRTRGLQAIDPEGSLLLMSCGASLFQLRLAMWHFGYEDLVEYSPDSSDPDFLARIELGGMRDETPEERALFDAIVRRRTDRKHFEKRELELPLRQELQEAATLEGAHLHFVESSLKESVIDLVERGDIALGHDPKYREDVARWTRAIGSDEQDGIPAHALGANALVALAAPYILRKFDTGKAQAKKDRSLAENAAVLVTLSTTEDSPAGWLAAGQALARVLLRACADGAYASFLNAPIETASLWPRLRRILGLSGFPLLLFRLGYVSEDARLKPTPRRSVGDVLIDMESYAAEPSPAAD